MIEALIDHKAIGHDLHGLCGVSIINKFLYCLVGSVNVFGGEGLFDTLSTLYHGQLGLEFGHLTLQALDNDPWVDLLVSGDQVLDLADSLGEAACGKRLVNVLTFGGDRRDHLCLAVTSKGVS